MKHLGNVGFFSLFLALLAMPLIGFGLVAYQPDQPVVLPAETQRFAPAVVDEVRESTEVTETTLNR